MRIRLIAVLFLFMSFVCAAQEHGHELNTETKAEVPALKQFHAVIYKLWHTAWPEKNVALLRSLLPEIEKQSHTIAAAELPGILRDKKQEWKKQVALLQTIVAEYRSAVADEKDTQLLGAAEKLHGQYEKLVRVVRPPLKELDEFHTVLYPLYHYYLPEYRLDDIKTSVPALISKMETLNAVNLPETKSNLEPRFIAKRAALAASINALRLAIDSDKKETIESACEKLHADYQGT